MLTHSALPAREYCPNSRRPPGMVSLVTVLLKRSGKWDKRVKGQVCQAPTPRGLVGKGKRGGCYLF